MRDLARIDYQGYWVMLFEVQAVQLGRLNGLDSVQFGESAVGAVGDRTFVGVVSVTSR